MCDSSKKKCKRSFVEAWLTDERYNSWIQKVPCDDNSFHCTICNKDFSCNTHISKRANSACYKNNIKEKTSFLTNNDNIILKKNTYESHKFRQQWLDIEQFQPWLREVSTDEKLCFCCYCEKSFTANLSHIYRHAESATHCIISRQKNLERKETNEDVSRSDKSLLSFDNQKKTAEIKFAAFVAEKNVSYQTAEENFALFKNIANDSKILQSISMSRTKCQKIISNVLCPVETDRLVEIIKNNKFSIFIDETSDISNQK